MLLLVPLVLAMLWLGLWLFVFFALFLLSVWLRFVVCVGVVVVVCFLCPVPPLHA